MTRYPISSGHGAMDSIPDEEASAVRYPHDEGSASVVAPDGSVTDGAENTIAGVAIVDVPSREEALRWGRQARRRHTVSARGARVRAHPGRA